MTKAASLWTCVGVPTLPALSLPALAVLYPHWPSTPPPPPHPVVPRSPGSGTVRYAGRRRSYLCGNGFCAYGSRFCACGSRLCAYGGCRSCARYRPVRRRIRISQRCVDVRDVDVPARSRASVSVAWSCVSASSCVVCPVLSCAVRPASLSVSARCPTSRNVSLSAARKNTSTSRSSASPYDLAPDRVSVSPSASSSARSSHAHHAPRLRLSPRSRFHPPPRPAGAGPNHPQVQAHQVGAPAQPAAPPAHPSGSAQTSLLPTPAPARIALPITILLLLASSITVLLLPVPSMLPVSSTTTVHVMPPPLPPRTSELSCLSREPHAAAPSRASPATRRPPRRRYQNSWRRRRGAPS
ncbi:hypothetical protein C8J57DRAFT_119897 [Mycena rebaudengoi]|nr:hypothetical protein C8J57DRAFT_119897 [Mycena rebaudengoi]